MDPAGDRLEVVDRERPRVEVAVPADGVERVEGTGLSAVHQPEVFRETSDAHATEADLVDLSETLAQVEGGSRLVLSAGLNDRAGSATLAFEEGAYKCGSEAAAEVIGINDQPMYVDRGSLETPGDCSGESSVNERAEKGFAAGLEFFECFPKWWKPSDPMRSASTR